MSNRQKDDSHEKLINDFLMKHFFSKNYSDVVVVRDKQRQIAGIDFVADGKYIDVKAQSSKKYINNPTNTFSMEISFILYKGGEPTLVDGWFVNPSIKTEQYAFVWIRDAIVGEDGYIHHLDDIHEVEVMVVDRKSLKEEIFNSIGEDNIYTMDDVLRDEVDLNQYDVNKNVHSRVVGDYKMSLSHRLIEMPVNIIVPKHILNKHAVMHCIIKV